MKKIVTANVLCPWCGQDQDIVWCYCFDSFPRTCRNCQKRYQVEASNPVTKKAAVIKLERDPRSNRSLHLAIDGNDYFYVLGAVIAGGTEKYDLNILAIAKGAQRWSNISKTDTVLSMLEKNMPVTMGADDRDDYSAILKNESEDSALANLSINAVRLVFDGFTGCLSDPEELKDFEFGLDENQRGVTWRELEKEGWFERCFADPLDVNIVVRPFPPK